MNYHANKFFCLKTLVFAIAFMPLFGCFEEKNLKTQESFFHQVHNSISYDKYDLSTLKSYSLKLTTKYKAELTSFLTEDLKYKKAPNKIYLFEECNDIFAVIIFKKTDPEIVDYIILKKNEKTWDMCSIASKFGPFRQTSY